MNDYFVEKQKQRSTKQLIFIALAFIVVAIALLVIRISADSVKVTEVTMELEDFKIEKVGTSTMYDATYKYRFNNVEYKISTKIDEPPSETVITTVRDSDPQTVYVKQTKIHQYALAIILLVFGVFISAYVLTANKIEQPKWTTYAGEYLVIAAGGAFVLYSALKAFDYIRFYGYADVMDYIILAVEALIGVVALMYGFKVLHRKKAYAAAQAEKSENLTGYTATGRRDADEDKDAENTD